MPFLDRPAGTEPEHEEGGGLLSKLGSIGLAWGTPAGMELEDLVPGDARRREIEEELRALQETGGGVVLGRAAAVLLRDDPRVLRVLLTGPPERRIEQGDGDRGHRPRRPRRAGWSAPTARGSPTTRRSTASIRASRSSTT